MSIRKKGHKTEGGREENETTTLGMGEGNVPFSKWANKNESQKNGQTWLPVDVTNTHKRTRPVLSAPRPLHQCRNLCEQSFSSSTRKIVLTNLLAMASMQEAYEGVIQLLYLFSLGLSLYLQQNLSRTKTRESHSHSRSWTKC